MPRANMGGILGLDSDVLEYMNVELEKKEKWIECLCVENDQNRMDGIKRIHENSENFTSSINSNRSKLKEINAVDYRRTQFALLILDTAEDVEKRLQRFSMTMKDIQKMDRTDQEYFYMSIPTFQIEFELKMEAYKNHQKESKINDVIDIGFLSQAISYYDILILEKFWADIIRRTKLQSIYNTRIGTNLSDIDRILENRTID